MKVHPLPPSRRRKDARPSPERSADVDQAAGNLLLDGLHRLAEDILDEPVPDRLRDALRKKTSEKN